MVKFSKNKLITKNKNLMKNHLFTFLIATAGTGITEAIQGINWSTLLAPLVGVLCTFLSYLLNRAFSKKENNS